MIFIQNKGVPNHTNNHTKNKTKWTNKKQVHFILSLDGNFECALDEVFWTDSTQEEVFDLVGAPVARDVILGFNGTIFAYGQTGSGKTFR